MHSIISWYLRRNYYVRLINYFQWILQNKKWCLRMGIIYQETAVMKRRHERLMLWIQISNLWRIENIESKHKTFCLSTMNEHRSTGEQNVLLTSGNKSTRKWWHSICFNSENCQPNPVNFYNVLGIKLNKILKEFTGTKYKPVFSSNRIPLSPRASHSFSSIEEISRFWQLGCKNVEHVSMFKRKCTFQLHVDVYVSVCVIWIVTENSAWVATMWINLNMMYESFWQRNQGTNLRIYFSIRLMHTENISKTNLWFCTGSAVWLISHHLPQLFSSTDRLDSESEV